MKSIVKICSIALLLAFFSNNLLAQKYGHVNTGNLLVLIPATKAADEKLKAIQDSLVADGQARAKKVQEEYMAFAKLYQEGNVPPAEAQKKQAEFEAKEKELAALEDAIAATIAKKRDELLGPILDKLEKAINDVGKEGGYTMIFDTSIFNALLFAADSGDVEPLVKAKLGI
ncbi:MAG: OmpH family outer membrane protein [Saprospiraceae bacterium]|nr:OmpH family outer membrane protein [Saprospiraceae bacterium]